jgi:hypothetical protein
MYLPGKCNKTFKMGDAGSFTFEDGKVRARAAMSAPPLTLRRSARHRAKPPPPPPLLQTVEVDAKKSAECIPLDEASLKIYDNMIKVRHAAAAARTRQRRARRALVAGPGPPAHTFHPRPHRPAPPLPRR